MEVLETSVHLVVKAPNQQIDDQVVECSLGWTVHKLKTYLSEVYPSRPKTEEQKLIYSGQLLHDHLTLKDFLRQYDTEKVHTVHLVCVPSKDTCFGTRAENAKRDAAAAVSNGASSAASAETLSDRDHHSDGLRQRLTTSMNSSHSSDTAANPMQTAVPNFLVNHQMPNFTNPTDQIAFQQMAWMQQVYGQYVNHYYQRFQYPSAIPSEVVEGETNVAATAQNETLVPDTDRQPAANENVRMNAQGGPVDDDDEEAAGNWDWLDWAYVLSRAAVLLSIVYFYSSLGRFVTVTIVTIFMYLHHMGWLNVRRQRRPPNPPPPPPPERNRQPEVRQPAERHNEPANDNQGEEVTGNVTDEQMERETREIEELMNRGLNVQRDVPRTTSLANFVWTFVTTFFSSLLPETPAPVNLN